MRVKFKKHFILATSDQPVLLCRTCGKYTIKFHTLCSNVLQEFRQPHTGKGRPVKHIYSKMRNAPSRTPHRSKTWSRVTKTVTNTRAVLDKKKVVGYTSTRERQIYFSYFLIDCIAKKHKLSVRKAPFSDKMVSAKV